MHHMRALVAGCVVCLALAGRAGGDDPGAPVAPPPASTQAAAIPDPAPWLEVKGCSLAGVSRDGRVVAFLKRFEDTLQLWRTDPDGKATTRVTQRKDAVDFAVLSPDGSKAVVGYDKDGDENAGLFLVDVTGDTVGKERELIATPGVQHGDVVWSKEGDRIFFRSNSDSKSEFHLFQMFIADGATRRVLDKPGMWSVEDVAPGGKRLLVSLTHSNYDSSVYLLDLESGALTEIDPMPAGKTAAAGDARFLGSTDRIVFLSDRGDEHRWAWVATYGRLVRPLAQEKPVVLSPDVVAWPPDLGEIDELVPSLDGRTALLVENADGWTRVHQVDVDSGLRQGRYPEASGTSEPIRILASGARVDASGNLFLTATLPEMGPSVVARITPSLRGTVVLADRDTGSLVPKDVRIDAKAVTYPSLDRKIPAWLHLPAGRDPKGLPFIVHVHGGPEGQARPYFSGETAYLLSLGFGILEPNVRGSTGYGKTYRDLDNYKGRINSVRDVKACADWLAKEGYADPKRIAVMGGSYGGYMVLACLTEFPDTFAAGVEAVGIANFETFLERTAPYRRALREAEYGPLTDREFLRSISPIHKVDKIVAPLLIAHGEQDPRVPVGEARQMEAALKALGRPVQAIYFPDEGHGWQKKSNRLVYLRTVAEFLTRYLKP